MKRSVVEGAGSHAPVVADVGLAEVCTQVIEHLELEDPLSYPTGRTVFRALFDLMRARRAKGLGIYPADTCQAVMWLLVPRRSR